MFRFAQFPVSRVSVRCSVMGLVLVASASVVGAAPAAAGDLEPNWRVEKVYRTLLEQEPAHVDHTETAVLTGGRELRGHVVGGTDTSMHFETLEGPTVSVPVGDVIEIRQPDVAARRAELRAEAERRVTAFDHAMHQRTWMGFTNIEITALGKFFSRTLGFSVTVDPRLRGQRATIHVDDQPLERIFLECARQVGGRVLFHPESVEIVQK